MSHKLALFFILSFTIALGLLAPQEGTALSVLDLIILSPGDGSIVTTPFQLAVEIHTNEATLIRIIMVDQNNTVLARQVYLFHNDNEGSIHFTEDIPFEISTQQAPALLTIAIYDAYLRPMALRAVSLTLQSEGAAKVQSNSTPKAWITLTEPRVGQSFSGGQVKAEGSVTPLSTKPIHFELITESGVVIGSRQLAVDDPGEPAAFIITIPHRAVTTPQEVRLVIRQPADGYVSNIMLDSLTITLIP